jgi:hypothetical protein
LNDLLDFLELLRMKFAARRLWVTMKADVLVTEFPS